MSVGCQLCSDTSNSIVGFPTYANAVADINAEVDKALAEKKSDAPPAPMTER